MIEYSNITQQQILAYESADMSYIYQLIEKYFDKSLPIREFGCGTGRDLAKLNASGYNIIGVDSSSNMRKEARKLHPEVAERIKLQSYLEYSNIYAIASVMHLENPKDFFRKQQLLLPVGGHVIISVPDGKRDVKIPECGFSIEEWKSCFDGFYILEEVYKEDSLKRNFKWVTFVLKKV